MLVWPMFLGVERMIFDCRKESLSSKLERELVEQINTSFAGSTRSLQVQSEVEAHLWHDLVDTRGGIPRD